MSGVDYGLFGYVWMKSRFDPGSGLFIHPTTVFLMMAWLLLCMTPGSVVHAANAAHLVGLGMGLAIGYAPRLFE
jgi:GlpG protein